jgi:hypothetical protein
MMKNNLIDSLTHAKNSLSQRSYKKISLEGFETLDQTISNLKELTSNVQDLVKEEKEFYVGYAYEMLTSLLNEFESSLNELNVQEITQDSFKSFETNLIAFLSQIEEKSESLIEEGDIMRDHVMILKKVLIKENRFAHYDDVKYKDLF